MNNSPSSKVLSVEITDREKIDKIMRIDKIFFTLNDKGKSVSHIILKLTEFDLFFKVDMLNIYKNWVKEYK